MKTEEEKIIAIALRNFRAQALASFILEFIPVLNSEGFIFVELIDANCDLR